MAERIIELTPGTYDVYGDSTSSVTVPVLTAGTISDSNPNIGDTLTVTGSNVSGGSQTVYQWQQSPVLDSSYTNISGATGSTFLADSSDVTADNFVRRGVQDGLQSMVYTPGVQISEAATFAVTYQDNNELVGITDSATTTLTISGAGEYFVIVESYEFTVPTYMTFNGDSVSDLTINGGSGVRHAVGHATVDSNALEVNVRFSPLGPTGGGARISAFKVDAFGSMGTIEGFGNDVTPQTGTFTVSDGGACLGVIGERGGISGASLEWNIDSVSYLLDSVGLYDTNTDDESILALANGLAGGTRNYEGACPGAPGISGFFIPINPAP